MDIWRNDEGEIWNGRSIVLDNRVYISPSDEILIRAGYHKLEPATPDPLDIAKADKLNEIDEYDQSIAVNIFYLSGQPMWLDAQTRQQLRTNIDAYQGMGIENVSKWFNGQEYTFPVNIWLTMLNALEVYAGEALNVTEQHKAEVLSLQSIEEVEQYDITVGYPEILNLTPAILSAEV